MLGCQQLANIWCGTAPWQQCLHMLSNISAATHPLGAVNAVPDSCSAYRP